MSKSIPPESDQPEAHSADSSPTKPTPPRAEALPHSLLAETVKQAPVSISITDDRANILYINLAFTTVTGYAPKEIIGRNESVLSDRRTPKKVYEDLWSHLQQQIPWQGRLVNRHKDGYRYLADLTVAPILNRQGETTHYIGMHRDVTDVYKLERQVIDQKVLIETVVDSMPVATILLDESSRIVLDNHMYKTLTSDLGLREPYQEFLEILRREMGEEWELLRLQKGSFRNREIRFDRGGRHAPRWFACAGTWFSRGDDSVDAFFQETARSYLLLILDDISQQKKREADIRLNALRAIMAEEEKKQSLRETLSGAMHHIQTPLNLLNAAKTLLERRGQEQNTALLDILDQILAAGQESLAQLNHCIPESDSTAMTPVNLNQLLHETIVLLTERLLATGIVVDWKPTPILPSVMGMENRLRAMFKQIVENAIDAMSQIGVRKRELRISTWPDDALIHVCIEDTGPGIPENLHIKVFEPFYSGRSGGGRRHSGMGLAMAQEVINQHLGLIRFDTSYREGCRVRIQLPFHPQPAQRSQSHD
ncbi:MAG: nitrogen fixation negative regulator NifL [Methylococcaceae bacterium]|nr:nitrogen fixation negative regulator NifL [Methylococcaceae bacterium]